MKKEYFLLLLIFLLAGFLRFYRLGGVPAGFYRDEAFLGYNAYSILQTGKDMSGNFLPLHLQSFLYSPAGYSYFSIPFIKIFGLNSFSVRFASAFFGTLTVLITYFLVKTIFDKFSFGNKLSAISAFLLTISPWHINLSRTATENTIVVFFVTLGVLFYLLYLKKDKFLLLILSFLYFVITLLTYQAPRAFLPFFIPLMIIIFYQKKLIFKKIIIISGLFLLTIILPFFLILRSPEISLRIRTVSIFYTQETQLIVDEELREDGVLGIGVKTARFFHNKPMGYFNQFFKNYFSHFSYDFLFTDSGLPNRYKVPGSGLLYLIDLPLLILGLTFFLKYSSKIGVFLMGWVLLGFIGAGLTFDDMPNLQRTLIVFPALSIISGVGLYYLLTILRKIKYLLVKIFLVFLIFSFSVFNFLSYLHQYYVHQLNHRPWYRQEGYQKLVKKVNENLPLFKEVIITDWEPAPTIFFLFFGQYDPQKFQEETKNLSNKQDFDRINFYKYKFVPKQCPLIENKSKNPITGEIKIKVLGEKDILYVNQGACEPVTAALEIAIIKRGDNNKIFKVLAVKD